jgi:alcohol dehydrogenase
MKMKAAVMRVQGKPRPYAESHPMTIETVDLDPPGPGEVLYKIIGAGLCHSDLSTIENLRPRRLPTIPGHEAAGIVEEVGPGVTSLKPGDHVVSMFVSSCGDCRYCNNGRPNLCQSSSAARNEGTLVSGARRLSLNGEPLNHYSGLSVFAQYAVVSQSALIKIRRDVPLEDATIFGCAVVTGVGAVLNTAQVPPGARMAVVGLGGVGMNALMGGVVAGRSASSRSTSTPTSCDWRASLAQPIHSLPGTPMWWRKSVPPPTADWITSSKRRARSPRCNSPTRSQRVAA